MATSSPSAKSGHEGRTLPVFIIDQPSESTLAVIRSSIRQMKELNFIPTSVEALTGRVGPCNPILILFSVDSFCKLVAENAKVMQREVEVDRANSHARKENEQARKERQKEKCAFFWQQAEELFHSSFNRIREERKHKAIKKDSM